MCLSNLVNKCFIEVKSKDDFSIIEKAKTEYKLNNICILFFHYNKDNIISDHETIKYLENKTKMHINYIDISELYNQKIKIIKMLDLYVDNSIDHINRRNKVELKHIIEDIKEQIIRYKKILEYKGI